MNLNSERKFLLYNLLTQSKAEKPPKSNLANLIHSGTSRGGVNAFGPFFVNNS
jgi:hypothetical protein